MAGLASYIAVCVCGHGSTGRSRERVGERIFQCADVLEKEVLHNRYPARERERGLSESEKERERERERKGKR